MALDIAKHIIEHEVLKVPKVIDDLKDVDTSTTAPAVNQILMWDGTNWVPADSGQSFEFSINTFTCSAGVTNTIFSIGSVSTNIWAPISALAFSATYNNGPAINGSVVHAGWTNLVMGGTGFTGPTQNTEVVTYPSVGGNKLFTLYAKDAITNDSATVRYYFYNSRYWGVSTKENSYTEADIEGLAGSDLSNSKAKTFTVTPITGEYIVFSHPSRMGSAVFTVGGFEGGFQDPETVGVTNAEGYTEDFYIYRSTNDGLGGTTVVTT